MTITTTQLGPNTTQINLSNETSAANFITALDTAITSGGWTQYDVSNQYNRIYSCLNTDGVTYKLIGITIDPGTFKISTTSYELWNNTTHVGTNQAYTYNRAGMAGFALNFCDVLVMVSSKWLLIQTFIRNQPGPWSGVIEMAREAVEDTATAGFPCWAWISSATVYSTAGGLNATVSFPRTVGGLTGLAAATNVGLQMPIVKISGAGGNVPSFLASSQLRNYAWNTSNRLVQEARPVIGYNELHGQLYGMKFTYNVGQPYNQVSMPVDSNFNYSATGTTTPHWVLGGHPTTSTLNMFTPTVVNSLSTRSITTPSTMYGAVPVNANWYLNTNAGVFVVDDTATTMYISTAPVAGAYTTGVGQIVFDGVQYVYAASSSGISKIDTLNNNAVTTLAISGGVNSLCYDGTSLWAGATGTAASRPVYQITPSTLTIAATITVPNINTTYISSICSDNSGNTYVLTTETAIYKIVNSTSAITKIYNNTSNYNGVTTPWQSGMFYNGDNLTLFNTGTYIVSYNVSVATVLYISTTGSLISTNFYSSPQISSGTYFGSGYTQAAPVCKLGLYDFIGSAPGTYPANGTGFGLTSIGNGGFTGLALPGIISDGNRAWASQGTTFTVYNGLFCADEGTTPYGRMLLPK